MASRHQAALSASGKRSFHRQLLLAAIASFSFNHSVASQPGSTYSGEVTPRGQREVSDVTYGDWKKLCFKPGGAQRLCRTSITGTFATGQMAVRLDIIEPDDGGARRLQVFSPVGMYLQNPVKLSVDQGRVFRAPYTWCLANTCIAGRVAKPALLKEMMTGQTLRLEFVDSNLLSLIASLPLARFALVRKGEPLQSFEHDIDE